MSIDSHLYQCTGIRQIEKSAPTQKQKPVAYLTRDFSRMAAAWWDDVVPVFAYPPSSTEMRLELSDCKRELERVTEERNRLHEIIRECLTALNNGSGATNEASIEFLSGVPAEIRVELAKLHKNRVDI